LEDPENNYATLVNSKFGEHSLVYAAEVDCCACKHHTSLEDYCEIKTSRGESERDLNFEKNPKFFKWYIQSHLVGTELFHVGLRNDTGIVNKIISVKKSEMAPKVIILKIYFKKI
jgi:RAT1-interacting protein